MQFCSSKNARKSRLERERVTREKFWIGISSDSDYDVCERAQLKAIRRFASCETRAKSQVITYRRVRRLSATFRAARIRGAALGRPPGHLG